MEDYEILDVEDIIELHDMLIRDFGGMSGIFPDGNKRIAFNSCEIFYTLMAMN